MQLLCATKQFDSDRLQRPSTRCVRSAGIWLKQNAGTIMVSGVSLLKFDNDAPTENVNNMNMRAYIFQHMPCSVSPVDMRTIVMLDAHKCLTSNAFKQQDGTTKQRIRYEEGKSRESKENSKHIHCSSTFDAHIFERNVRL